MKKNELATKILIHQAKRVIQSNWSKLMMDRLIRKKYINTKAQKERASLNEFYRQEHNKRGRSIV